MSGIPPPSRSSSREGSSRRPILFKPLSLEEITTIVDLLVVDLNKPGGTATVALDKKAREWTAEKGYDPVFGARPLRRFLQRSIETKLARGLISGEVPEGANVTFTVKNDELTMASSDKPIATPQRATSWAEEMSRIT